VRQLIHVRPRQHHAQIVAARLPVFRADGQSIRVFVLSAAPNKAFPLIAIATQKTFALAALARTLALALDRALQTAHVGHCQHAHILALHCSGVNASSHIPGNPHFYNTHMLSPGTSPAHRHVRLLADTTHVAYLPSSPEPLE